jgi:hypothetical protein
VYEVAVAEGVNETEADALPGVATTLVGGNGTGTAGRGTPVTPTDSAELPDAFTDITVHVYVTPFVKEETIIGLDVPVVCIASGFVVTI